MCLGLDAAMDLLPCKLWCNVFQNPSLSSKVIFAWRSSPPPPISLRVYVICHALGFCYSTFKSFDEFCNRFSLQCNDWNVFEQLWVKLQLKLLRDLQISSEKFAQLL